MAQVKFNQDPAGDGDEVMLVINPMPAPSDTVIFDMFFENKRGTCCTNISKEKAREIIGLLQEAIGDETEKELVDDFTPLVFEPASITRLDGVTINVYGAGSTVYITEDNDE